MSAAVWGVSALLFLAGLAAVVMRHRLIAMLLGLELMLSAVNVPLVYHAGRFGDAEALSSVLLLIAIAAAEAVVGLSLVLMVFRSGRPADAEALRELRG